MNNKGVDKMFSQRNFIRNFLMTFFTLFICTSASASNHPGFIKYNLGGDNFYIIADILGQRDLSIFKDADSEILQKIYPTGKAPSSVNTFLLQTNKHNILFDAGYGKAPSGIEGNTITILSKIGVTANDIDIIMLTHTHNDHVNGLLLEGVAAFPNAMIYISQKEDSFWEKNNAKQRNEIYKAYNERIVVFAAGDKITSEITSVAAYGHTPGHTAFLLKSKVLIAADYMHAQALQLAYPQICPVYDMDKDKAISSRKMLLNMAIEKDLMITGSHMNFPSIGKTRKNGDSYSFLNMAPQN